MADDLSVLLRLRGENAQLKSTVADSRAAISSLRTSAASDLKGLQSVSTQSLGAVTQSLTQITSSIPGVGRAFSGITSQLGAVAESSAAAGGGLAAMAGPIAAAVAGIALLAGGIVTLSRHFFGLTKQTAEFQGKLFDLSQQVGVSVETLSTLDVIASTTGGNIDSVTASLGIFQKHLEASHDPTSKEAKLLAELGVTSTNVEVALRQTIKGLFDLTDKTKQTDAALQLFGRGGRFVNAILKESHGDLDAATAKFQELGLVVSGPAAAAADHFNDSLEILSRQFDAIGRQLTSKTIPVFITLFEDINEGLTGSKDNWTSWGNLVETTVAAAIAHLKTLGQLIATRGNIDPVSAFFINRDDILNRARRLTAGLEAEDAAERAARLARTGGSPGDAPDASKAAAAAQQRAAKEIALTQRELERSTAFNRTALERERELDLKSLDEWLTKTLSDAQKHLADQQVIFDQERTNARRFIKDRRDRELALREIDLNEEKAVDQHLLSTIKAQDEANKRRAGLELALNRQLASIRDTAREGELQRIKDELDRKAILESEAIARTLALLQDEQAQRLLLIEIELGQETTGANRKVELDNVKIESEQRFTDTVLRLTNQRLEAAERESLAARERATPAGVPLTDDQIAAAAGAAADQAAGLPPALDEFSLRAEAISIGIDTMREAFYGLGQAIGSVVEAFVLYGTAGTSVRKVTAEILASVARQAAVQAVFQLAEGFAKLAMAFFGVPNAGPSAAAHFQAAALYGVVAGVAAVAGRGAAGNAFNQGGKGSGEDTGGSRGALDTIVQGRNQRQDRTIRIHLTSDLGELQKVIVGHVVRDYNDGGEIREVIANDGR